MQPLHSLFILTSCHAYICVFNSVFLAPSSAQTLLVQTSISLLTSVILMCHALSSPFQRQSPRGPELRQAGLGQYSTVTILLPHSSTVTGAPSREQDFRRTTLSYPRPPNVRDFAHTLHRALAFLPREDQGLCLHDSGRGYTSHLMAVGGSPATDLWKCFQAVCLKHGIGSRAGTHQYAKRCLQHLRCLIKRLGGGEGGLCDQAVVDG